jgi:hypothetical protein
VFAFAGMISGLTGALYTYHEGFVGPGNMGISQSTYAVLYTLFGGAGAPIGASSVPNRAWFDCVREGGQKKMEHHPKGGLLATVYGSDKSTRRSAVCGILLKNSEVAVVLFC